MKKVIRFDKRAEKEFRKFPRVVQVKAKILFDVLERDGRLEEPYGKKLDSNLFEIRLKSNGQWRILYAYLIGKEIIILSAFQKKTQQTPLKELKKTRERMKIYK
jgi:phage-related protein